LSADCLRPLAGRHRSGRLPIEPGSETISAEIVTLENSLVQRMKVDRRAAKIEYED
jgi:hypothetical protein